MSEYNDGPCEPGWGPWPHPERDRTLKGLRKKGDLTSRFTVLETSLTSGRGQAGENPVKAERTIIL
jgi:hypothetical protein